jgi:ABC-type Fe2+-enterobactin transport system substrate-binding protein
MRTHGESNQATWLRLLGIIIIKLPASLTDAMNMKMRLLIQLGVQLSPLCANGD